MAQLRNKLAQKRRGKARRRLIRPKYRLPRRERFRRRHLRRPYSDHSLLSMRRLWELFCFVVLLRLLIALSAVAAVGMAWLLIAAMVVGGPTLMRSVAEFVMETFLEVFSRCREEYVQGRLLDIANGGSNAHRSASSGSRWVCGGSRHKTPERRRVDIPRTECIRWSVLRCPFCDDYLLSALGLVELLCFVVLFRLLTVLSVVNVVVLACLLIVAMVASGPTLLRSVADFATDTFLEVLPGAPSLSKTMYRGACSKSLREEVCDCDWNNAVPADWAAKMVVGGRLVVNAAWDVIQRFTALSSPTIASRRSPLTLNGVAVPTPVRPASVRVDQQAR
ncbi:hypothetical protein HPB50_000336 [Hyalomma asiaticum]|uniref:Uncharacterized protein n=1 Tax=Hyalomma asiaticum TaxID=266040 RepID=A0ACB7T7D9_HYAAI|nr:hypothetical protein HPB50_000336 [Hyalomma asiaticum]